METRRLGRAVVSQEIIEGLLGGSADTISPNADGTWYRVQFIDRYRKAQLLGVRFDPATQQVEFLFSSPDCPQAKRGDIVPVMPLCLQQTTVRITEESE